MGTLGAERGCRHRAFPFAPPAPEDRLPAARVAIVGCGALGAVSAELLGRAGAGFLRPDRQEEAARDVTR